MTKWECIDRISKQSNKYGDELIRLMDKHGANNLQEITEEQAREYLATMNRRVCNENYCSDVTKGRHRKNNNSGFDCLYIRRGTIQKSANFRGRPTGRHIKDIRVL